MHAGLGVHRLPARAVSKGVEVIVLTTVVLFSAEAALALSFAYGLWWFAGRLARAFITQGPVWVSLGDSAAAVANLLRRFMLWQIFFVAVWSVCFKGVLYTSLMPWKAHDLMANGASLGIAIPAEVLALLLALVGGVHLVRRGLLS